MKKFIISIGLLLLSTVALADPMSMRMVYSQAYNPADCDPRIVSYLAQHPIVVQFDMRHVAKRPGQNGYVVVHAQRDGNFTVSQSEVLYNEGVGLSFMSDRSVTVYFDQQKWQLNRLFLVGSVIGEYNSGLIINGCKIIGENLV